MVSITFQCQSTDELKNEMLKFLNQLPPLPVNVAKIQDGPRPFKIDVDPVPAQPAAPAAPAAEEKKSKAKRAKKESEPVPFEQPTEIESAENESPAAIQASAPANGSIAYSKEGVHQALQSVNVNVNLQKAREILAEFKVNRLSELTEAQFKPFIDKCNEAVMMHG
jgi:hypothetical protein